MTAPVGTDSFTTPDSKKLDYLVSTKVMEAYPLPKGYEWETSFTSEELLGEDTIARTQSGKPTKLKPELAIRHTDTRDIVAILEAKDQGSDKNAIERGYRWLPFAILGKVLISNILIVTQGAGFARREDGTIGRSPGVAVDTWSTMGSAVIEANGLSDEEVLLEISKFISESIARYENKKQQLLG